MNTRKKQIIVLQGPDNTGKTATLKCLIQKLLPVAKKVADEGNFDARMRNESWDVWAIFEYHGRYIGITTRGDAEQFISKDIRDMEEAAKLNNFGIDTYICAVHSYGKTVDYIKNKAKTLGTEAQVYGKATYRCSNALNEKVLQAQINELQADFIFKNL
jgi:Cdc6-like AAA superfamily ATPase